jgi:hypothetical protein
MDARTPEAHVWSNAEGIRLMRELLPNEDLSGWTLESAAAVSSDGLTIVGNGTHNGVREGWIARLR